MPKVKLNPRLSKPLKKTEPAQKPKPAPKPVDPPPEHFVTPDELRDIRRVCDELGQGGITLRKIRAGVDYLINSLPGFPMP